jgi:hypothetical protein
MKKHIHLEVNDTCVIERKGNKEQQQLNSNTKPSASFFFKIFLIIKALNKAGLKIKRKTNES